MRRESSARSALSEGTRAAAVEERGVLEGASPGVVSAASDLAESALLKLVLLPVPALDVSACPHDRESCSELTHLEPYVHVSLWPQTLGHDLVRDLPHVSC